MKKPNEALREILESVHSHGFRRAVETGEITGHLTVAEAEATLEALIRARQIEAHESGYNAGVLDGMARNLAEKTLSDKDMKDALQKLTCDEGELKGKEK